MKQSLKQFSVASCALIVSTTALGKLPAQSDEARSKAAEAAAKSAWSTKVDAYQLCKSQDRVVAHIKNSKIGGKDLKLSACVEPGEFSYMPAVAVPSPAQGTSVSSPSKK